MKNPLPPALDIHVSHPVEVGTARRAVKTLVQEVGLEPLVGDKVALVVSELATNLIRHAGGGRLVLTPLCAEGRLGIRVESIDQGPGIPNIPLAMKDGFSTAGGFGTGLGTIHRLMDELTIDSSPGQGTYIVCSKWGKLPANPSRACPLDIGVATRPKPDYEQNGDSFVIVRGEDYVLVGVIDGLGHGPPAQLAAQTARRFVESHAEQSLEALFQGADYACHGTRGCVMALARFDWRLGKMLFASVGNIEARVVGALRPFNFTIRRGIIGLSAPKALVTEHEWLHSMLVLYSDGVRSHWSWADFSELADKPATIIAQELLRRLAKPEDDATVLIVKGIQP